LPDNTIFDAICADPAHFNFCAGCVQRIAYPFDPLFGPGIKILRFVLAQDDSQVFKQGGFPAASAIDDTVLGEKCTSWAARNATFLIEIDLMVAYRL
jgi:hypothetical protein